MQTHQMDLNWVPNVTFTSMHSAHNAFCTSLEGTQTGKNAPKPGLEVVIATSHSMMNCGAQSLHGSCNKNPTMTHHQNALIPIWRSTCIFDFGPILNLGRKSCFCNSAYLNVASGVLATIGTDDNMLPECTPSYLKEFQLHQQLAHPKMGLRMLLCDISCLNLEDFHMIDYCDQIQQLPVIELYPFMSEGNMLCYDDNTMGILVLCSSGPVSGSPIMILKLQDSSCDGITLKTDKTVII